MKRTKLPKIIRPYDIDDEPIVISKKLIDTLLQFKNRFSDLFALYCFYYYTAKWQHTDQPKVTTNYTATGIGWGRDKVIHIKSILKRLGLIEDIVQHDSNGRIIGHFIKIYFVWSTTPLVLPRQVNPDINALNPNKRKYSVFDDFIKLFPNNWQSNKPFQKSIQDFIIHRKEKGKSLTPLACTRLANHLSQYKLPIVIQAIEKSIYNGWTGVFPESIESSKDNKYKPPYKEWEGRRYYLCPDGEYRNRAGSLFIE